MTFEVYCSLITSIISSIILIILTVNFVFRTWKVKAINKATKDIIAIHSGTIKRVKPKELRSNIRINIIMILITFTIIPIIHSILYGLYILNPAYQSDIFRERLLYTIGMRAVPISLLYVFFFQRLYYIFKGSVLASNISFYIKGLIIGLSIYWIFIGSAYTAMILIIEYRILSYKSIYLALSVMAATGVEIIISTILVIIVVKRLKKLGQQTKTEKDTKDPNYIIKYAAKKIFILTMTATISTQILTLIYSIRNSFNIDKPPIIEVNIDSVINAFCVILSVGYYKKEYNICCCCCVSIKR